MKIQIIFISFFALLLSSCQTQNKKSNPIEIKLDYHDKSPSFYNISFTKEALVIDGSDDEPKWQHSPWSSRFVDISLADSASIPHYSTQFKMLWDSSYLYIYAKLEEPHIWGNLHERDTVIYYNNDFEVFIDPNGDTYNYGEIEINALNTVWDLLLDKPYSLGGKANNHWDINGFKSAVYVNGTLNNNRDIDSFWSIEMAIPMKALLELKNKPRTIPSDGEQWMMNFSRVHWDHDLIGQKYDRKKVNEKYQREYNWVWNSQNEINMHIPERWGIVEFSKKGESPNREFHKSDKWELSRIAYQLFRDIRFGKQKSLLGTKTYDRKYLNIKVLEYSLPAIFNKTEMGFEILLGPDLQGNKLAIDQNGKLKWFN